MHAGFTWEIDQIFSQASSLRYTDKDCTVKAVLRTRLMRKPQAVAGCRVPVTPLIQDDETEHRLDSTSFDCCSTVDTEVCASVYLMRVDPTFSF